MQYIAGPTKTFTASGALTQWTRVRLNGSNKLAACGWTDTDCIGVVTRATFADGEEVAVLLRTAEGTMPMIASEAITAEAEVYAAASGKIATSGTVIVGEALEAASGNNSVIEVLSWVAATNRGGLAQEDAVSYPLLLKDARVWDSQNTPIVADTAANDDLALLDGTRDGTPGNNVLAVINAGNVTDLDSNRYCKFEFPVPAEYVAGQTITLRINAEMVTAVAGTSCGLDIELVRQAAPTVDICATAEQDMNFVPADDYDFTITPTNVVPGDVLDFVIDINFVDATTATMIPTINAVAMLLDIKG